MLAVVILEVAGTVLLLMAAWMWWKSLRAIVRGRRSRSWPVAPGVIKAVQVVKKNVKGGREAWRHRLEYSYSVGAGKLRGTRIQFGIPNALLWNNPELPSFRHFEHKDNVDVFYCPSKPSISALERGYSPFVFVTLAVSGAVIWMGMTLLTVPG